MHSLLFALALAVSPSDNGVWTAPNRYMHVNTFNGQALVSINAVDTSTGLKTFNVLHYPAFNGLCVSAIEDGPLYSEATPADAATWRLCTFPSYIRADRFQPSVDQNGNGFFAVTETLFFTKITP